MVNISKYLEKSEKFIQKNTTILLLLFIICLLILLYVKYHKFTVREGNELTNFQEKIKKRKSKFINILDKFF